MDRENLLYVESFDSDYYTYLARRHLEPIETDDNDRQRAAIALRNAYHHGLETLFALLLAAIQAPHCVFGWILHYRNKQLRDIVTQVDSGGGDLPNPFGLDTITWEVASAHVNRHSYDKEGRGEETRELFAELWSRFALDLRNNDSVNEYNSIKHGFRARPGGFHVRAGIEESPGEPAPPENMQDIGGSEFGSSFLVKEPIEDAPTNSTQPHFQVRQQSLNWNPEAMAQRLQLISMSLRNITSALKMLNGVDAASVQFVRPEADEAFTRAWDYSIGPLAMSVDRSVEERHINRADDEDLLNLLSDWGGDTSST